MFFVHPMWSDESERLGMQRCTPVGYSLRLAADLVGFAGLLLLLITPLQWLYKAIAGSFHVSMLWRLVAPIGVGLVSEVLYQLSSWLAAKKDFRFDYERREASWREAGERRTYRDPA